MPTPQSTNIGASGGIGPFPNLPHQHGAGTLNRQEPLYDPYNVYSNGVLIALYNAATTPGTKPAARVPTVTVSQAVQNEDGEDTSRGKAEADRFLAEGKITKQEYDRITAEYNPSTAGVAADSSVQGNNITVTGTQFDYNFKLTPNGTTLGDMIKKVTFPRTIDQLSQGYPGMTPAQIVNNLANLAYNIVEPLKKQYPRAFLTNSFRHGASIGGGQHGTGQACDIQFRGVSAHDYFDIAVWMAKNLPYDQLLLEFLPSKTVWIHVSYAIPNLPTGGLWIKRNKPQNKLATLNGAAGGRFVPNLHKDIVQAAVPNRIVAA